MVPSYDTGSPYAKVGQGPNTILLDLAALPCLVTAQLWLVACQHMLLECEVPAAHRYLTENAEHQSVDN